VVDRRRGSHESRRISSSAEGTPRGTYCTVILALNHEPWMNANLALFHSCSNTNPAVSEPDLENTGTGGRPSCSYFKLEILSRKYYSRLQFDGSFLKKCTCDTGFCIYVWGPMMTTCSTIGKPRQQRALSPRSILTLFPEPITQTAPALHEAS